MILTGELERGREPILGAVRAITRGRGLEFAHRRSATDHRTERDEQREHGDQHEDRRPDRDRQRR
ncbi:MAG: hypothetical protein H6838_13160 [Planctomycetes bacterium]|nr:hypothetical protein [Planctomycetota bacterium]